MTAVPALCMPQPHDDFYVGFVDLSAPGWWCRWLKPGFRHCWAMGIDWSTRRYTLVEYKQAELVVRELDRDEAVIMLAFGMANGCVIRARRQPSGRRWPRLFCTCVSVTAHLLGVEGWLVTPHQLYRRLLAQGAFAFPVDASGVAAGDDGPSYPADASQRGA